MIPSIMSPRGAEASRTSRTLAIWFRVCFFFRWHDGTILRFGILAGGVAVKITLVALLILLCSELVCAQEKPEYPSTSGNAYLRECSVIEKDLKDLTQADMKYFFACLGYTEGVMDGAMAEAAVVSGSIDKSKNQLAPFCVPSEADNGQLVRITLKYIRKHPEEAHKPGYVQIIRALREAFPCGGQTGKRQ